MRPETVAVILLTCLVTILASLDKGDAKSVAGECLLIGYKKIKGHCTFVACPQGFRKVTKTFHKKKYCVCLEEKRKVKRKRIVTYINPYLIYAFVQRKIAAYPQVNYIRSWLHRVRQRINRNEKDLVLMSANLKHLKGKARNVWEKLTARIKKALARQCTRVRKLLHKVKDLEQKRREALKKAHNKLKWWTDVAMRHVKEARAALRKSSNPRLRLACRKWGYFLRKLNCWLKKVERISARRKLGVRVDRAWIKMWSVQRKIRQAGRKILTTTGKIQEKWKKKRDELRTLLRQRKAYLKNAIKLKHDLVKKQREEAIESIKKRIAVVKKVIEYREKIIEETIKKLPKDKQWVVKQMQENLKKLKRYLKYLETRLDNMLKCYRQKPKGSKKGKKSGPKQVVLKGV